MTIHMSPEYTSCPECGDGECWLLTDGRIVCADWFDCGAERGTWKEFHGERPRIVCLCGSTRFVDEFNRQRKALTEAGEIVLSIEVVTTQAREDDPQHCDPELKARLDELHKRKIDLADYCLILNVGGYIGESTRGEIKYANQRGKEIRFLEPIPLSQVRAALAGDPQ